jgi:hypothetical protein
VPAPNVVIRFVEKFPEPAFQKLQREIFARLETHSSEFTSAIRAEPLAGSTNRALLLPPMVRFGAYSDQELVGWTYGWFQRPDRFCMANSGVIPSCRRLGIYSRLVEAIVAHASAAGAGTIHSWHSVLNTPVIIAKLKLGFIIEGTHFSDHLGLQVEVVRHISQARRDIFRSRVLPFAWPSDI